MARDRLIGEYGKIATGALGSEETTTFADGTYYLISGVDGSSALDGSPEVGYLYRGGGETLAAGDAGYPYTFTDKYDLKGGSIDMSKAEVDVTGLCDTTTLYKAGKTEMTGAVDGNYIIGQTDIDGGIQNNFVAIARQASGTYSIDHIDDSLIYLFLYKQKAVTAGETEILYLCPITLTSFNETVAVNEAQGFTSGFRITSDDTYGALVHCFEYTYA